VHLLAICIFLHSLSSHEHKADCEGHFTRFSTERRLITTWTEIRSHQIRVQIFHFIARGLLPNLTPVVWLARRVELARLGPPCVDADIAEIREKIIKADVHCVLSRISDKDFADAGISSTLFRRAGLQLQPMV
jgi:hypothetical protein